MKMKPESAWNHGNLDFLFIC